MLYLGLQTEKRKNLSDLITWSSNLRETNGMVALKYRESQAADDIQNMVRRGMHMSAPRGYYQLAEDGSAFNEISGANAYYMDGHYQECEIDGQPVDEQTFIDYQNKYGELIKCYSDTMYSTVMEAYNNLEK